ncbi:MAG: ester cyclase [Chloroflexi bacterium]|nr:ester cyclase [Chloroflexota bacterium]
MSTAENKSLIRRYVEEIYNKANLNALDELLAPNYTRYLATGAPLNRDQQRQRLAGMRAAFPDIHLEVVRLIAENDFVTMQVIVRGTQRGAFMGVEPTGREIAVPAIDIVRIENGKMVEHWGGMDSSVLIQQLKG